MCDTTHHDLGITTGYRWDISTCRFTIHPKHTKVPYTAIYHSLPFAVFAFHHSHAASDITSHLPDQEYNDRSFVHCSTVFKTVTNWQGIHSVPLVPLRIMTGLLMIHHGSEGGIGPANFNTPQFDGFIEYILTPYFGFLPGPPELWSAIHDYIEFYGGICLALGFLTRPAALSLLGTMMGAVYFHLSAVGSQGFPLGHVESYSYDFEEPMLYGLIFLMFWFNGAGPLSVDSVIYAAISEEELDEQEEQEEQDE